MDGNVCEHSCHDSQNDETEGAATLPGSYRDEASRTPRQKESPSAVTAGF